MRRAASPHAPAFIAHCVPVIREAHVAALAKEKLDDDQRDRGEAQPRGPQRRCIKSCASLMGWRSRPSGLNLTGRQAMIGTELVEAEATESVKAFHSRLVEIARAKGKGIVSLGSDEPVKASPYDQSGKLIEPPVLH